VSNYKFILSGGGTGGHIYPAIAIANELKSRYPNASFLFVGAKDRMEMEKVPQAGYEIEGLWISGLQRKLTLKNLSFPFKLISSLWKARKIIKKEKPDVVIGTGGYASGPLMKVASSKGISCIIQEQNSFPGITNRLLAKKAKKICVAYDGLDRFFPVEKIIKTGNPVREDFLDVYSKTREGHAFFELDADRKTVLIIGGSQGARMINKMVERELNFFKKEDIQLIWQCGKLYYQEYKKYNSKDVRVHQFLNKMDLAYAAADIIISRAGASSVSELCIIGKPVIFIPSPNVAEDHQSKNAAAVVENAAAIAIKEPMLEEVFEIEFLKILKSEAKQNEMSVNIKKLALPEATKQIVDEIEELLK